MPISTGWSLTIGVADVSPYLFNGARFVETASSTQGLCTCTINGAHAEIVPGASILLASSDGTPLWEGVVTTAAPQYDSSGTQIATMLLGSPLSSQLDVGTHYVATTAVDISDLAVALCSQAPVPFGSQGDLGSSGGALSIRNVASGLTVAALISRKHWRVQNGSVTFVGPETMQSLSAPLSGSPVSTSSVVVSGGLDTQSKQALQGHFPTVGGVGAAFFADHPELSDASTLAAAGAAYAQRFGPSAINAQQTLDPGTVVRAGDWFTDPNGASAHAQQVEHRLVAGSLQPTVQFGYPALPLANASDTVPARQAHHPSARLVNDFLVSGAAISTSGLNATLSTATVVLNGAKVPVIAGATLPLPSNSTILLTASATGFAQSTNISLPAPGTAVPLYLVTTSGTQIIGWENLAPHGGIGSYHLKPANPVNTPSVTAGTLVIVAEGAAAAKATVPFTINGLTLDDTIGSIEIVQSFAGANSWGNPHAIAWSPTTTSFTDVRHGLSAGQGYDIAVNILGRDGKPLNASPLLIGTSPTISATAITAAIANWNEFGGTLNTDGTISNADGATAHTVIAASGTIAGAVIHAEAMISKGANTGGFTFPGGTTLPGSGLYLFNGTTGYFAVWQSDAHFVLYQNNAGTVTALGSVYVPAINQSDTNAHFVQLTMRLISGGQVALTASIDNVTALSATGSTTGSLIGSTVSCQVGTGGSNGKISRFAFKCGVQAHDTAPPSYTGNFDSTGKATASTMFIGKTPNTVAYVSDATIEFSWSGTGPYSVKIWFDSGTAGADSTVIWPDGTPSVNLGHTTSASPSFAASSIPASTNYYAVLHVQNGVVTMTVQTTPFTTAQFAAYFADGGIVPAAAQAGTPLFTASGSGGSGGIAGGGGGHNLRA